LGVVTLGVPWVLAQSAVLYVVNNCVGIGTATLACSLQMGSGAWCSVGGARTNASGRAHKREIQDLSSEEAEAVPSNLAPVQFAYEAAPAARHVGFIAEDVPALVATPDRKGSSTMDVVAVVTKVIQEPQKTIAKLKTEVAELKQQNWSTQAR
jgi:hypothetical protein